MKDAERIDFVIPWVDGSDPQWLEQFGRYARSAGSLTDASRARYRDWDTLRYWFRSVERFTPWVGRIHFVTWGHLPPWLNAGAEKLHVVRHEDYIPPQYLPTFNSHTIELNLHRIDGLAERFVYFNDDTFVGRPLPPERFFRGPGGLPCDVARLGIISDGGIAHIILNDVAVTDRRHSKRKAVRKHPGKWFNFRYSAADMLKTLSMLPWSTFGGFKDTHMPQPFLKETFARLWRGGEEAETLDRTCRSRFRALTDVNQYLMRYEQLARGEFSPTGYRDTRLDTLSDARIDETARYIRAGRYAMFCLNDDNEIADPRRIRETLLSAFDGLLPDKSAYEL